MADTKFFIILVSILAVTTITSALIIQSYTAWNLNQTEPEILYNCPAGAYCPGY